MRGYSPFPPEIFLNAGSHAGHEVVEVHDDVDPHVEEPAEGRVASPDKPDRKINMHNVFGGEGLLT